MYLKQFQSIVRFNGVDVLDVRDVWENYGKSENSEQTRKFRKSETLNLWNGTIDLQLFNMLAVEWLK